MGLQALGGARAAWGDYDNDGAAIFTDISALVPDISVTVNGDLLDEPNETYFVNLSNPANATIADSQGQGTIRNDDSDVIFNDSFEDTDP